MKYENAYTLSCNCPNDTDVTFGVRDSLFEPARAFGKCIICGKLYKKKKVKKTKIENGEIVPTPTVEVFE